MVLANRLHIKATYFNRSPSILVGKAAEEMFHIVTAQ